LKEVAAGVVEDYNLIKDCCLLIQDIKKGESFWGLKNEVIAKAQCSTGKKGRSENQNDSTFSTEDDN